MKEKSERILNLRLCRSKWDKDIKDINQAFEVF